MNRAPKLVSLLLAGLAMVAGALLCAGTQETPRSRTFEFTYVTRIPVLPPGSDKLRVWIPVPESDPYQQVSNLTIESPIPYKIHREPEYRNQYAYFEIEPAALAAPIEVRLRFRTERREHKVSLNPAATRTNSNGKASPQMARYLKSDRLVPVDGIIAALAEQETRGRQLPLDKARAIYDYVVSTLRYDKSGEGWGRGDAIYACTVRKGNCTDFHALFIGMMRAAGIPARFEIGFPLPTDQREGEIGGYHCWAQFYLEGIGWVPVDASEAWKNPARRDYFFGAHDEHRVLFTRGRDVRFNPAQQGEPLNYFIYPYAELDAKPFPNLEYKFSFRDLANPAP